MKLKVLTAIAVAGIMVMSVPMVAMAYPAHTHNDSQDHGSTPIPDGVKAYGSTAECKTTGDVGLQTLGESAIYARYGATVTAGSATNNGSNQTVYVDGYNWDYNECKKTYVTITGAVTNNQINSGAVAIAALNDAVVKVGSATNNSDIAQTVSALNAAVTVDSDITNDGTCSAVRIIGGTNTLVEAKKIKSKGNAVDANEGKVVAEKITSENGEESVYVYGGADVTANQIINEGNDKYGVYIYNTGATGTIINVYDSITADYGIKVEAENEDGYTVNVYQIVADNEDKMIVNSSGTDVSDNSNVKQNINYIVKDSDGTATYKNMNIDKSQFKTVTIDGKEYITSTKGTITVTVSDGYKLTSTKDIISVGGNTYTVTIPTGGGVTLEAIIEAVERASHSSSNSTTYTTGWHPSGTNWQYVKPDGSFAKNEWLQINLDGEKKWYHFGNDTMMDTGWFRDTDGTWYYLNKENDKYIGTMYLGWLTDPQDGYRYYLDPANGKMHTGWHVVDGKKHYFCEGSATASGWTQDANLEWVYDKRNVIPLGAMIQ